MAHRLTEFTFARHGRPRKYPWEKWFDGSIWRLVGGEDFTVPAENFRRGVLEAARQHGVAIRTSVVDGDVIVQASALDGEGE